MVSVSKVTVLIISLLSEEINEIIEEATTMTVACYGLKSLVTSNMFECSMFVVKSEREGCVEKK